MSQVVSVQQMTQSRNRNFRLVIGLVGLVAIIVIAVAAYMLISMTSTPANLDTSDRRVSEQGLFRGSWVSQLIPININQIHTWTIHIETLDGQPLDNGQITVDGGMPQHGHGLPTQPKVMQYLGQGNYRVEGMKFNMPGWWVVKFHVTANGKSDILQFNVVLQ